MRNSQQKRSARVTVTILATIALSGAPLSACAPQRPVEALRCVDSRNESVVDESLCRDREEQGGSLYNPLYYPYGAFGYPYGWYYGGSGASTLGSRITGGSYDPAPEGSYRSSGGVQRGGIGSTARAGSGASGVGS
jgi:hypothetical protein